MLASRLSACAFDSSGLVWRTVSGAWSGRLFSVQRTAVHGLHPSARSYGVKLPGGYSAERSN